MKCQLLLIALVLVAVSSALPKVKRQTIDGFPTISPPTPTPGTTTTTASPQYRSCLRSCPATSQYNPVCGTNGVTYNNEGLLNCARRCGTNVQVSRGGACSPAT